MHLLTAVLFTATALLAGDSSVQIENGLLTGGTRTTPEVRVYKGTKPYEDANHKLSDLMSSYWVNFAATGDPNGKDLPKWPVYTEKSDLALELGVKIETRAQLHKAELDFIEGYFLAMQVKQGIFMLRSPLSVEYALACSLTNELRMDFAACRYAGQALSPAGPFQRN